MLSFRHTKRTSKNVADTAFKVLKLLACEWRKECVKASFLCVDNGINCANSCKINSFGNMQNNDEDESDAICCGSYGEYDDSDLLIS